MAKSYKNKPNTGSLFINERKTKKKDDYQPHFTGYIMVNKELLSELAENLEKCKDPDGKSYKAAKLNIATWKSQDKSTARRFGVNASFYKAE